MTKPQRKKEPVFRKIENGMIFISEDGILVGLPIEVETRASAEGVISVLKGGKAGGEKYSKVKYTWHVISGNPLSLEKMNELKKSIADTSGTIVTSLDNAAAVIVACKKCGFLNLGSSKFCSNCGNPL
jgi:hypothetical protein